MCVTRCVCIFFPGEIAAELGWFLPQFAAGFSPRFGQSVFGTGGQNHDPHLKDFAGLHVSLHNGSSDSETGSIDLGVLFTAQEVVSLRSSPLLRL